MWNEKSWHYRLVSFYATGGDNTWYNKPQDFCTYLRKMGKGLMNIMLFMIILYFIFLKPIAHVASWVLASIHYGILPMDDQTKGFLLSIVGLAVIAALAWAVFKTLEHYQNKKKIELEKNPALADKQNFFSMAWSKFHDKTCFPIDYKED